MIWLRYSLFYLISSDRPIAELLAPHLLPLATTFEEQFLGMSLIPVTLKELETTRDTMIEMIQNRLSDRHRQFLLSFRRGEPDWSLLNLDGLAELPAVQWKLLNVRRMRSEKREEALERLRQVLLG